MKNGEQRRLCVSSSYEDVRKLADFTREACKSLFSEDDLYLIELAVVEAINNVVEHCYKEEPEHPIELIISCADESVMFRLVDTGKEFRMLELPDQEEEPDSENIDELSEKGRGLFLINHIMDDIIFSRERDFNILTMWKKRVYTCPRDTPAKPFIYYKETTELIQKFKEMEESRKEMEVAANMHKDIISKMLPHFLDLELFARSESALQVGGDYLTLHKTNENTLWFMICDAMGKGMSASFFSILSHMTFQSVLYLQEKASPGELLTLSNKILSTDFDRFSMFMTALVGKVDIEEERLYYASAGHCPPILFSKGKGVELLDTQDYMMGVDTVTRYRTYSVPFKSGMKLLTYTDGITDITDSRGEMAGVEPLLYACASEFERTDIADACDRIFEEVKIASGDQLQDDISMIGIEFL